MYLNPFFALFLRSMCPICVKFSKCPFWLSAKERSLKCQLHPEFCSQIEKEILVHVLLIWFDYRILLVAE